MRTSAFSESEEQAQLRATARAFVTRHAPERDVRVWDEEGSYPERFYREIARLGWYDMVADADEPVEDTAALLITVCEEIGRASSDLVALLNLNISGIRDLARWGTPEQRKTYAEPVLGGHGRFSIGVSEPDVGSDAASVATRAERADGGWVLNGQKTYCEAAGLPGTVMELLVKVGDGGRKRDDLAVFLVPADHPGVEVRRMPALGRNISGIYEVFLHDVRLPDSALLGRPGQGWQILKERLVLERIMISSGFLGSVASVLDMTVAYANEREQFGRTISAYQGVSLPLAEMFVRMDAARCAVQRSAALFDAGAACEVESTMAKFLCGQIYAEASALAMQTQGAYGYVRDHTLPMHHSDGIIARVVAGPPAVQLNVVARSMGLRAG
ncbi:acyl-CoA dehydrogenase family protein [Actinacidiphila acidipaludis]|uniref:Acyl-CoA/acyl-ACP dehydrogenase n=1 Tax=Actinacidiphila acidipaludis TaxID=2873382 RepID=A0ABS7PZ99_9ACTN|nr:acyl-CoA dehydrogenase family protein [Streptomyces acidipaludis]MBY8876215.1 acyl-CoA/acyl-ACP dehydrogenase [Streptomyces acidipaludis]